MSELQKLQPVIFVFLSIIFFIPTIVGVLLRRNFKESLYTNIILGFTWVGWIAAIAWSITGNDAKIKILIRGQSFNKKLAMIILVFLVEVLVIFLSGKITTRFYFFQ